MLTRYFKMFMQLMERIGSNPYGYWGGFVIDTSLALAWAVVGLMHPDLLWNYVLLAMLGGYLGSTLVEYIFHRWLFHLVSSPMSVGHLQHHETPKAIVALPFFLPGLIAVGFFLIFTQLMPYPLACVFMATGYGSYVFYGLIHHLQHHLRLDFKPYKHLRQHHLVHHVYPNVNFGVSTTIWDWVFRTHFRFHDAKNLARDF